MTANTQTCSAAVGNTVSFVVFIVYGGVFFGWGAELTPRFVAGDAYSPTFNFFTGELEPSFAASLGALIPSDAMASNAVRVAYT